MEKPKQKDRLLARAYENISDPVLAMSFYQEFREEIERWESFVERALDLASPEHDPQVFESDSDKE